MARIETTLATALATDLGSSPQDPTPHMVASAAVAALYRSAMTGDHFHPGTKNPKTPSPSSTGPCASSNTASTAFDATPTLPADPGT
ncbi:hypothetical protein AB0283_03135 [Micromonospora vinacea]|uniref:hypothetical protein n=1 Tax=Micromonospora vinacea TaxID=709878 RepID=UPI00344DD011